jgi:adenylosuccinate lyase
MPVPIPNVLADRYASPPLVGLFDPAHKVRLERRLWLLVLDAQIDLGLGVPRAVVADYESVLDQVDLESIRRRERTTRHDVKARLEEFCALAGHEHLHAGMTSRDLTENVEQLQVWQALGHVRDRTVALAARMAERAAAHAAQPVVARTHNVPAQPTTVGKRFAQAGEELLAALDRLDDLRSGYALRGIKGPVGTQADQIDLLGSAEAARALDERLREAFGIPRLLGAVGQVYPRSLDYAVVATLLQLAAGPASLALTIRLMAGHDLATEGFRPGQVGSSAMPHKMNTRSCERIDGLQTILRGHLTMAAGLAGEQWNEGDVSCSVVRRVVIPDAFFALDGLYETAFAVVGDFGTYPAMLDDELTRYLPFLATTAFLVAAVRAGSPREQAHEIIKGHAVDVALEARAGRATGMDLVDRLAADPRFPVERTELAEVVAHPERFLGSADQQVAAFVQRVDALAKDCPVAGYAGGDIL